MNNCPSTASGQDVFATGAIRESKHGKGRYAALSPAAIRRWALRAEEGQRKYGDALNYRKGLPLSNCLESALRHLFAYLDGDDSEDHLGAALWNLGAAAETEALVLDGKAPQHLLDAGPLHRRDWRRSGGPPA